MTNRFQGRWLLTHRPAVRGQAGVSRVRLGQLSGAALLQLLTDSTHVCERGDLTVDDSLTSLKNAHVPLKVLYP